MMSRLTLAVPDGLSIVPAIIAFSFSSLMVAGAMSPPAATMSGAMAGAMYTFRSRLWTLLAALLPLLWIALYPATTTSPGFWAALALMVGAALMPPRFLSLFARLPREFCYVCAVVGISCLCAALLLPQTSAAWLVVPACLCAATIGVTLTRHLALADARILAWGEDGLSKITRDLLLGRITSGMLHDLAQPLNVISMANGNLSYIIEHIAIEPDKRAQIAERIRRISANTENAASILSLFRWFGRVGNSDHGLLNVRSALERAIASTRSNVRHAGVSIEVTGDALDYLLSQRHGTVEMMAVASLLSAFGGFILPNGTKIQGHVLLRATQSPAHIVVSLQCLDEQGQPSIRCDMDRATLWLVEQIARESSCEFRYSRRRGQPSLFSMRIPRDDI